ncbi:MAG: HAMP domain-containing protein [bacterium]|nr:HAMP domain-containing protein [bacterium]
MEKTNSESETHIKFGVTAKLMMAACVAIFLAVILTGGISYIIARSAIIDKMENVDLKNIITMKAEKIDARLSRAIETALSLAQDPVLNKWFVNNETNAALGILAKGRLTREQNEFDYSKVFAINRATKNYWAGNNKLVDRISANDPEDQWFFQNIKDQKKIQINIDYNKELGDTFVFMNALMGDIKNPDGLTGVSLKLNKLVEELLASSEEYADNTWLAGSNRKIQISRDKEQIGKDLSEVFGPEIAKAISTSNQETSILKYNKPGQGDMMLAYGPMKSTNWIVISEIPLSDLLRSLNTIAIGTAVTGILSIALVVLFFFFVGKRTISSPVNTILRSFDLLSQGNLSATMQIESKDEFTVIAEHFNLILEKLSDIITHVQENSESLAASSEEISSSAASMADNASSQSASGEEISATIEQISAGMDSIVEETKSQDEVLSTFISAIGELSEIIIDMGDITRQTLTLAEKMSSEARSGGESLKSMSASMSKITASSDDMTNIIQIINDISDQINLLSLNAAIEAARAGEAGRGFAVVADEISRLADQTAQSLKEIDSLVKANNDEINNGMINVTNSMKTISLIIKGVSSITDMMNKIFQYTEKQIDTNKTVNKNIDLVKAQADQIRFATEEHKTGVSEVVESVNSISDLTQANASGSEQMAANSEELASMAEKLRSLMEFFKIN